MRLGIISDAHHYYDGDGRLCTLTPLARQFEQWAALFDEVIVCAPLLPGPPPGMQTPYLVDSIRLLPVVDAGGNSLRAKLHLVGRLRQWWSTLRQLISSVDAIHIRCPNNISILGLIQLRRSTRLCQSVYTGNWNGYPGEPATYRWQRWFLTKHFRGPVAVYGEWPGQPAHIVPTFSPSYSDADWEMESDGVMAKIQKLQQSDNVQQPVKLISVGALNKNKNHQLIVHAVKQLADRNIDAHLTLLGEGPERNALTHLIESLGLGQQVHLNGNTSQADVRGFYRDADFVVQPSLTEGFSKVPLEACFHGAIPLLSDINLNPQVVGGTDRGRCYPVDDASLLARHIAELSHDSAEMVRLIKNCRDYAHDHTLESWRQHIKQMLERHWQIRL